MKAILQRVRSASVTVDQEIVSQIAKGIVVFAAVGTNDTKKEAEALAAKILRFKLFDDEAGGRWKRSVADINGEVLCVSQFTLLASTRKGNKPDFHKSANGEVAKELYNHFFTNVQKLYQAEKVKDGIFQAMMDVQLINDGPVTIEIDVAPPPQSDEPKAGQNSDS